MTKREKFLMLDLFATLRPYDLLGGVKFTKIAQLLPTINTLSVIP